LARFKRTGDAVVAADLGAAMASPEGCAAGRPMPASRVASQFLTARGDTVQVLEAAEA
jgi:hypothetical protein